MDDLKSVLRRKPRSEQEVLYHLVIKYALSQQHANEFLRGEIRRQTSFFDYPGELAIWYSSYSEHGVYDPMFIARTSWLSGNVDQGQIVLQPGWPLRSVFGPSSFSFHDPDGSGMKYFIRLMINAMNKYQHREGYYDRPSLR